MSSPVSSPKSPPASSPASSQPATASLGMLVAGRFGGILLALLVYGLLRGLAPTLTTQQCAAAAITVLMAVWWMTEALPLAVTSLMPLVLFPLTGVLKVEEAARPYADKNIFLFMGGFLLALAIEKSNLHRRIALLTVSAAGTNPMRLIGGVMLATGAISMWISNTATAAMMLPIGLSLISLLSEQVALASSDPHPATADPLSSAVDGANSTRPDSCASRRFATCMMLGIAYAASIGGMGTLVGTPTNVTLAGFAQKVGFEVSFATWARFGVPLALVYLLIAWLLLTWWLFPIRMREIPGGRELIRAELRKLGRISRPEITVSCVFTLTALAWLFREPLNRWLGMSPSQLDDSVIGMCGALVLFLIPVNFAGREFALDWPTAMRLPWGVLILFGGGFALAAGLQASQLDLVIGEQLRLLRDLVPPWLLVTLIIASVVLMSELASNTPTAATFLPIVYGLAQAIDAPPLSLLIPVTLGASCGFMLPVGTPPNAIAFGSGYVTIRQMMRAGFWLDLVGVLLISLLMQTLGVWVFQIHQ